MKKLSVFSLPSWVTCSSSPTSSPSASLHSSIASWPEMGLLTACISGSCTAKLYRQDGQWCDFYTLAASCTIVLQYQQNSVKMLTQQAHHTACIWFWMAKDVGIASDGNFSSYLIGRSWYNHFRSFSMEGCTNRANPANQPISEKLPKWHFLIHAWNSKNF